MKKKKLNSVSQNSFKTCLSYGVNGLQLEKGSATQILINFNSSVKAVLN